MKYVMCKSDEKKKQDRKEIKRKIRNTFTKR